MANLNLYILTFNCGRELVRPDVFSEHVFDALPSNITSPDIIVLNLQEIASLGCSFLGGSFLTPYFNAFRRTIKLGSTNSSYVNTISRNVGLTAIMVFVRDDLTTNIAYLHTAGVGVGVQQTGNKGAAAVRIGYRVRRDDVMQMTFVSAHLAPMEDALQRRNEDYQNIARGLVFTSAKTGGSLSRDEEAEDVPLLDGMSESRTVSNSGIYNPDSYLFVAGDLNYRTSEVKPTEEDVQERFPQPTKDVTDPRHFSHLLAKDQLTQQLQQGKTLNGLSEMPINFPPTYKYHHDDGKAVVTDEERSWNWAPHRWPSWCDRVLYLDHPFLEIEARNYQALPILSTSDHRPVALSVRLPLRPLSGSMISDDDIRTKLPFPSDPDWKSKRDVARRKEIIVGLILYLTWTYEGLGLLLATMIGICGGYLIIRSQLQG